MQIKLQFKDNFRELNITNNTTGNDLFDVAKEMTKLKEERIRIQYFDNEKKKKIPINKGTKISEIKAETFDIKDLGPQIKYSLVFYMEYLGPFVIFPILLYFLPHDPLQSNKFLKLSFMMWMFHFYKRLLETAFVHIFSHPTMPLFNLFKNCTYYYTFAFFISYFVIKRSRTVSNIDILSYIAIRLFFIFEILNFYCHIKLRKLRPKGSKRHFLPKGFLFNYIISPNYTTEILAWLSYALFTRVIPSFLFCIIGAIQMYIWAKKKKRSLCEEFPIAEKRGTITPFF